MVETLTDFDGRQWSSTPFTDWLQMDQNATLWPPYWNGAWVLPGSEPPDAFSKAADTTITFLDWNSNIMPIPTTPRTVNDSPLSYNPSLDMAMMQGPLTGATVQQSTWLLDRTKLADAIADDTTGMSPDDRQVPVTSHTNDLSLLASQLTVGIASDYDRLMAIQDYLTSPRFHYTLQPLTRDPSDDAVWDFIERGTGYCVHFATAMIVLGRLAGIPMRAALGFVTPKSGTGTITDSMAHMWPQAYFEGIGWVDFEPTPGGPMINLPNAAPSASPSPTQQNDLPTLSPSRQNTAAPSVSPTASTPPAGGMGALPLWWLLGVVIAIALIIAARVVWSLWVARYSAERAWASVLRAAGRRQLIMPSSTPKQVQAALGPQLSFAAKGQLADLAAEVVRQRYQAPRPAGSGRRGAWYRAQAAVVSDLRHRHAG